MHTASKCIIFQILTHQYIALKPNTNFPFKKLAAFKVYFDCGLFVMTAYIAIYLQLNIHIQGGP